MGDRISDILGIKNYPAPYRSEKDYLENKDQQEEREKLARRRYMSNDRKQREANRIEIPKPRNNTINRLDREDDYKPNRYNFNSDRFRARSLSNTEIEDTDSNPFNYESRKREIVSAYNDFGVKKSIEIAEKHRKRKELGYTDKEGWLAEESIYDLDSKLDHIESKLRTGDETFFYNMQEGYYQNQIQNWISMEAIREMEGLPNQLGKLYDFLEEHPELEPYSVDGEKQGKLERAARGSIGLAPLIGGSVKRGLEQGIVYGTLAAGAAAAGGQLGPQALTPEEIITMPIAAIMGFKFGMGKGAFQYMAALEAGGAYQNYIQAGINKEIAKPMAETVGVVNGLLELAQAGSVVLGNVPGVGKVVQKVTKMAAQTGAKKLAAVGATYGAKFLTEVVEEGLQESVTMIGLELSKEIQGGDLEHISGKEFASSIWDTMVESGYSLAPLSFGVPAAKQGLNQAGKGTMKLAENAANRIDEKRIQKVLYDIAPKQLEELSNNKSDIDIIQASKMLAFKYQLEKALKNKELKNKDKEQMELLLNKSEELVSNIEYEALEKDQDLLLREANTEDIENTILDENITIDNLDIQNKEITNQDLMNYREAKNKGILDIIADEVTNDSNLVDIANKIKKKIPKDYRKSTDGSIEFIESVKKVKDEILAQKIISEFRNVSNAIEIIHDPSNNESELLDTEGQEETKGQGATDNLETNESSGGSTNTSQENVQPSETKIEATEGNEDISEENKEISEGKPIKPLEKAEVYNIPTKEIQVDPERFQFRIDTNSRGATKKLTGAEYNENLAGTVLLWEDKHGDKYVVNGHHRVSLAKDFNVESMKAEIISHKDYTEGEARALGAMKNIAEGSASPIDVAKMLREGSISESDFKSFGIAPGSAAAKNGVALSKLNDFIFRQVATRKIPLKRAVIIGRELDNHDAQNQVIKALDKLDSMGKSVTNKVLEELIAEAKGTKREKVTQTNLFGEVESTKNYSVERAELVTYVKGQLKKTKKVLKNATKGKDILESLGNKVNVDENVKQMDAAEQLLYILDKTLNYQGTKVNDLFNELAKEYANSDNPMSVKKKALEQLMDLLENGDVFETIEKKEIKQEAKKEPEPTGQASLFDGIELSDNKDPLKSTIIDYEVPEFLKDQEPIQVVNEHLAQTHEAYNRVKDIIIAAKSNPLLNGQKIKFIDKENVKYYTRSELDGSGNSHLKEGWYAKPGQQANESSQAGEIVLYKGATRDTISEELIHAIQRNLREINPELTDYISNWEENVKNDAEELGYTVPDGLELFAKSLVFGELGYANEDHYLANLLTIPEGLKKNFLNLLGKDLVRVMTGENMPETPGSERKLGTYYQLKSIGNGQYEAISPYTGNKTNYQLKPEGDPPIFYSKLQRTIEKKMGGAANKNQLLNMLKKAGIKDDEMYWSGIEEFMEGKSKVTKDEVLNFLRANEIEITEEVKAKNDKKANENDITNIVHDNDLGKDTGKWNVTINYNGTEYTETIFDFNKDYSQDRVVAAALGNFNRKKDNNSTRYHHYTLPEGENYKEILFILKNKEKEKYNELRDQYYRYEYQTRTDEIQHKPKVQEKLSRMKKEMYSISPREDYYSGHWEEDNVLAHTRINERIDVEGNKVLFVEEIQSDWHQQGRDKGYIDSNKRKWIKQELEKIGINNIGDTSLNLIESKGGSQELKDTFYDQYIRVSQVPEAPLGKNWHEFLLKRLIRYAAENGYDKLAWTTGEQQADRYNLANYINGLKWYNSNLYKDEGTLVAYDSNNKSIFEERIKKEQIKDYVGKEVTKKLLEQEKVKDENHLMDKQELTGLNLQTGGEGMKGFYNKMVPRYLKKYVKKWGSKVYPIYMGEDLTDTSAYKKGGMAELEKIIEKHPDPRITQQLAIDITDKMVESTMTQGQPLFQLKPATYDKNLVAIHNINESKLRKVLKLGGMPSPSVAITKNDIKFDGFGGIDGISLIGDKDLINPDNPDNMIFNTDIYSPTVPGARYEVNRDKVFEVVDYLQEASNITGEGLDNIDYKLKRSYNPHDAKYSINNKEPVMYQFLKEKGIDIEIPERSVRTKTRYLHRIMKEGPKMVSGNLYPEVIEFANSIDFWEADINDMEFRRKLLNFQNVMANKWIKDAGQSSKRDYDFWMEHFELDKNISEYQAYHFKDLMDDLHKIKESPREIDGVKLFEILTDETHKRQEEYDKWVENLIEPIYSKPKINKTNLDFTLDNLVKVMKKSDPRIQQETLGFNVAQAKAMASKQFASINSMHERKDLLMDREEVTSFLNSFDEDITKIYNEVEMHYTGESWVVKSEFNRALGHIAAKGKFTKSAAIRAFNKYNFDTSQFTDYELKKIVELAHDLTYAPTQYYEAKLQRKVELNEFKAAIMPEGMSQEIEDELRAAGIKDIVRIDTEDPMSRTEAIKNLKGVNFQLKPLNPFARQDDFKTSKWKETVEEAEITDPAIKKVLNQREFLYRVRHNGETILEAAYLIEKTERHELIDWILGKDQATDIMNVAGQILVHDAINKNNHHLAVSLVKAISEKATTQGQAIQALSLWARLTPEGITKLLEKTLKGAVTEKQLESVLEQSKLLSDKLAEINKKYLHSIDIEDVINRVRTLKPEELLANKIARDLSNSRSNDPIKMMINSLYKIAQETIPKEQLPDNSLTLVAQAIKNREQYQDVWNKAKIELQEKLKNDPEKLAKVKEYLDYDPEQFIAESKLRRAVELELKEMNKEIKDLVTEHFTNKGNIAKSLKESLIFKTGLTGLEAEILEDMISKEVKRLTEAEKQKQLNKLFPKSKNKNKSRKTIDQQIIDMSNAGAFDNKEYHELVKGKLGIPYMSKEMIQSLKAQAERIQELEDGSRDQSVAVAEMLRDVSQEVPVPIQRKIAMFQTMAQLLNFKTILRNLIGNTGFAVLEIISDAVAVPIDRFLNVMMDGGNTKVFRPGKKVSAQLKGYKQGLLYGLEDAVKGIDTSGLDTQHDIPRNRVFSNPVMKELELALNVALRATDRAAYMAAFEDSILEQQIIKGTEEITPEMIEIAHLLGLYRTFQDSNSISDALVGLKRGANKLTSKLPFLSEEFGAGDILLKYPKTPGNLLARGIDYSPAGIIVSLMKLRAYETNNPYLKKKLLAEGIARSLTGSALFATGIVLALSGVISGSGQDEEYDSDIMAMKRALGIRDYSFNRQAFKRFILSPFSEQYRQDGDEVFSIWGWEFHKQKLRKGDKIYDYSWYQPSSLSIALGADFALSDSKVGIVPKVLSGFTSGINTIAEQPMLTGINMLFGQRDPAKGLARVASGIPNSFVPTILGQLAMVMDDTVYNVVDKRNQLLTSFNLVARRIPGLNKKLEPIINPFGTEAKYFSAEAHIGHKVFNSFFNPALNKVYDPNPEQEFVMDLYYREGEKRQAPRVYDQVWTIEGEKVPLTPREHKNLKEYVGKRVHKLYKERIRYGGIDGYNTEEQIKILMEILNTVGAEAKEKVMNMKDIEPKYENY